MTLNFAKSQPLRTYLDLAEGDSGWLLVIPSEVLSLEMFFRLRAKVEVVSSKGSSSTTRCGAEL